MRKRLIATISIFAITLGLEISPAMAINFSGPSKVFPIDSCPSDAFCSSLTSPILSADEKAFFVIDQLVRPDENIAGAGADTVLAKYSIDGLKRTEIYKSPSCSKAFDQILSGETRHCYDIQQVQASPDRTKLLFLECIYLEKISKPTDPSTGSPTWEALDSSCNPMIYDDTLGTVKNLEEIAKVNSYSGNPENNIVSTFTPAAWASDSKRLYVGRDDLPKDSTSPDGVTSYIGLIDVTTGIFRELGQPNYYYGLSQNGKFGFLYEATKNGITIIQLKNVATGKLIKTIFSKNTLEIDNLTLLNDGKSFVYSKTTGTAIYSGNIAGKSKVLYQAPSNLSAPRFSLNKDQKSISFVPNEKATQVVMVKIVLPK